MLNIYFSIKWQQDMASIWPTQYAIWE